MPSTEKIVVLSNCTSLSEAQRIAKALVERNLAACVSVGSAPIESTYRWEGEIETAKEFLLLAKTSRDRFSAVEQAIRELHSYEVPEIIAIAIEAGSEDYMAWLDESLK